MKVYFGAFYPSYPDDWDVLYHVALSAEDGLKTSSMNLIDMMRFLHAKRAYDDNFAVVVNGDEEYPVNKYGAWVGRIPNKLYVGGVIAEKILRQAFNMRKQEKQDANSNE